MEKKIPVGILAATGAVGQRFVEHLVDHPWFEIAVVTGSQRTAGRPYGEGVNWLLEGDPPAKIAEMIVQPTEPNLDVEVLFSALPTAEARELEPQFAAAGYKVLTNASPYRMDPYVPLLIPEVNPDHSALIPHQQEAYGWKGFHRRQRQLLYDQHCPPAEGSAGELRPEVGRSCHHAGDFRCRLPRRGFPRYHG